MPRSSRSSKQPAEVVVGVGHEPGEHLHVAGEEPPLVGRQRLPVGDPRRPLGQHGVGGDDALGDLPVEGPLRARPPSRRRTARRRASTHSGGHLVRRVRGARGEVEEERLAGLGLLLVLDHPDRLVDQVLGEVVALLGGARRLDVGVVADQLGRPLAGLARRGSRSSARSPGPAASGRTGRRRSTRSSASGATCRRPSCCSRASRSTRARVAADVGIRPV